MLCRSLVRCRDALALGRGSCLAQPYACVQINGLCVRGGFFFFRIHHGAAPYPESAHLETLEKREQQQAQPAGTGRGSLVWPNSRTKQETG